MEPKDFIKAKEVSLVTLLGYKNRRFIIPYNQRPWSWKKGNLDEIWGDVTRTVDKFYTVGAGGLLEERPYRIGNPHFFGAFVFQMETDEKYVVVDGQQRLTSIIMLFSIFREIVEDRAGKTEKAQLKANLEKLSSKCTRFICVDNGGDDSKLSVDPEYKKFFEACIVDPKDSATRERLIQDTCPNYSDTKILKDIKESYSYLQKLVSDRCTEYSDEQLFAFLNSALETIKKHFIGLSVAVKEEAFSFEVFKCLNAKSLGLSEVDKIKNELFVLSELHDHGKIKRLWDSIVSNLVNGDIGLFIRYRFLALNGECSRDKMYNIIREKEISVTKPLVLAKLWEKDSQLFSWISFKKNKTFGANSASNDKLEGVMKEISSLRVRLAWIPCFAAIKTHLGKDDEQLYKLLQLIRNVSFRLVTVCKVDVGIVEPCLSQSARMIVNGKKVKDIARLYRDHSTDSEFESEFRRLTVSVAKRQFYILEKMDRHLSSQSGVVPGAHGIELNVEHILPRKFSQADDRLAEWRFAKNNPDKHKAYLNRLGNLCLLEQDINSDVSSFAFRAKQDSKYPPKYSLKQGSQRLSYKDSNMPMVKQLLEPKYSTWNFAKIDARQNEMAKNALDIWSLNGAQLKKLT